MKMSYNEKQKIGNLPWTQTTKDNALAKSMVRHETNAVFTLLLMKTVILWTTKINLEEACVIVGRTIFQARAECPRHHECENILRYVQKSS